MPVRHSSRLISGAGLPSIHAEHAILKYVIKQKILKKHQHFDIIVARISKSGILSKSCPCRDCILRLNRSNISIRNVYYIDDNGYWTVRPFNSFTLDNTKFSSYVKTRLRLD